MPTEDYDDIDEIDDYDEIEEIDDVDEIEEVDDVDEVDTERPGRQAAAPADRGRRQLRRGRLTEFSDRLAGGAARPGEQSVRKSPFVMVLGGAIIALALIALIFGVMILSESERRSFESAMGKLKEQAYPEAEKRLLDHLTAYAGGNYEDEARIGLHKARVLKYTEVTSYTVEQVKEGVDQLNQLIRVCQDLEGFAEERENVRRYAERLTRVGAIVAEQKKSVEALEQSKMAKTILEKYAGPDGVAISVDSDIRDLQRKAEAAILKDTKLKESLAEINGHLKSGDTFAALEARQALIDRYDALSDDADVLKILQAILDKEKELTTAEDINQPAVTEDLPSSGLPAASLSLRTQATVDQVSRGGRVFAIGMDNCYGLDSETGEPLWKRSVGKNPPFSPALSAPSLPDSPLLVYHTGVNQLLLLEQATGNLIWRQSIPSRPSGPPLIFQQQIYITTASGELWKLSVDSGRVISRVTFNQPVVGPPALTRDQKHLVIPGDQSVVYTLTVNPMKCIAVSYVEHRLGSVEAPVLTLGKMLLLCDNDIASEARLRILDMDLNTGELTVRDTKTPMTVSGQVRDPCLLRGTELFVPSTPQRVTAFSVNDDPGAEPLAPIGANQLENPSPAPVHLLAGPQGQLWMASEALRKFRVRTNAVELESASAASGVHLRPIQFKDQNVFVTTNEPYSSSVFFSKVEPQKMEGLWRTVVGTNIVSAGPSGSGTSLMAVSDFGEVFRVPLQTIRNGEFVLDRISRYSLPEKLREQVGGLELKDGRLAAFCGGEQPAVWTFAQSGQLEQRWPLRDAPQTQPVSLADGIVAALPGRLQMTAVSGTLNVQDYRAAQGVDEQTNWKSLVALNDTQVLAINSKNEAVRVEYRALPRPHLFEASVTPLEQSVDLAPAVAGDLLAVCTSEGNLQIMSTGTLELLGQVELGAVASASPFTARDRIFVEVGRRELRVFERSSELKQTGGMPLDGRFLVGTPVPVDGGFVACLSDGHVVLLDENGNETQKKIYLGQDAQKGPIVTGDALIVIGLDGSLYSVEQFLE
ncbi:MAG: PQQ-binding-like beta-propeller repeat protein [Fuerstiella sp.]